MRVALAQQAQRELRVLKGCEAALAQRVTKETLERQGQQVLPVPEERRALWDPLGRLGQRETREPPEARDHRGPKAKKETEVLLGRRER